MNIVSVAIAEDNYRHVHLLTDEVNDLPNCKVVWTVTNGYFLLDDLSKASQLPDILLLDLDIPKVKGILCLSIIKHLYPSIQIIVSSSFVQQDIVQIAFSEGASGFLPKYLLVTSTGDKALYKQNLQTAIEYALDKKLYINFSLFGFKELRTVAPSSKQFM
jgi:DNA-binding NarL/FixJ family response regulator